MNKVIQALQSLMGINGDVFIKEIEETNALSQRSYDIICDNVIFNSDDSIIQHFGIIQCYYFKSKRGN